MVLKQYSNVVIILTIIKNIFRGFCIIFKF